MIFNRTLEDITDAQEIRANKVQKFLPLTDNEVEILERGMLTINTLNRIERKQEELKEMFSEMGYLNVKIDVKQWENDKIFYDTDLERIINNNDSLKKSFLAYQDTPPTPTPKYYFTNINDLEKILFDLEKMVNDVKNNYRECGNFECGEG